MRQSLLPPRLRDWKPGTVQIGVFLRTADGAVFETTISPATEDQKAFAVALSAHVAKLDPILVKRLRAELLVLGVTL
jgi:hypothetical protein